MFRQSWLSEHHPASSKGKDILCSSFRDEQRGRRSGRCKGKAMQVIMPSFTDKQRVYFIFEAMRFGRHNKLSIPCCYPSSLAPVYQHCKSAHLDVKPSPYEWAIHLLTECRQSMWNVERLDTASVRDSSMQLKCEEHINHGIKWLHPNSSNACPLLWGRVALSPAPNPMEELVFGPCRKQRWRWPAGSLS